MHRRAPHAIAKQAQTQGSSFPSEHIYATSASRNKHGLPNDHIPLRANEHPCSRDNLPRKGKQNLLICSNFNLMKVINI